MQIGRLPQVLLIVQPYLTAYRLPVFSELARHFDETLLASSRPQKMQGYGEPDIKGTAIRRHVLLPQVAWLGGRLLWQRGLLSLIASARPSIVLTSANPRALSLWATLILCRLLRIPCHAYGQGLFNKLQPGFWRVQAYRLMVWLSSGYICYTASGLDGLYRAGIDRRHRKLVVAENSLQLTVTVTPSEKSGEELGILFLGRLREGCALNLLIDAIHKVRETIGQDLALHVVGAGPLSDSLKARYGALAWIRWHGERYQQADILNISRSCRVGCYPGAAGLSVVHFMGLSLIPVAHDRPDLHMGPEPSYLIDGVNGRLFKQADATHSLPQVLADIFGDGDHQALVQAAYKTYCQLNDPPLAARLAQALKAGSGVLT